MADRPIFQRSPRIYPQLPQGELEIPAPPPAPHEPMLSSLAVLWPLVPGLLGGILIYSIARAYGAGSVFYLAYSLPLMMVSYLVQIGYHYFQRRKYQEDVARREERYRAALRRCRERLLEAREAQQAGQREVDPDPAQCLERAERRDPRLWERGPGDADFLALRLGLGTRPLALAVKPPAVPAAVDPDPLLQEAVALAAEFAEVPGVPVRLALPAAGVSGLVGPRAEVLNAARALAMQLATHHAPDEVKLAVVFSGEEAEEWAWLRWLPHVWSDDRRMRLLAADREGARRLCAALHRTLQRRQQQVGQSDPQPDALAPLPRYVLLIADPALVEQEPLLSLALREGAELGALTVLLGARKEELPKECRSIVEVGPGEGRLVDVGPNGGRTTFFPDAVTVGAAERLARALAPLRPGSVAAPAEVPGQVPLLDLLGVSRVDALDVIDRWEAGAPHRSLAVPLGRVAGGRPLMLDLHERGHGPHGLVAGATGSGKSELLQTLVVSLAATFHPHEVAFVLVDYKGGGMAGAFAELPHLIGTITNLEGGLARRALAAIRTELKRRQEALAAAGVTHIDEYIRLRRQGRAELEPLPHMVLIVDEFAELKAEQPGFIRELISAVRVGRSLGVHLILATQKPAGVVDEQIWSNARFRLCLRVERPDDSMEVLRRPDAASITTPGRAYLQVGNGERFDLFQAGWGGAAYAPEDPDGAGPPLVAEVTLEGERIPLLGPVRREGAATGRTQLAALVEHLARAAEESGIERLAGPWLPPLPEEVALEGLLPQGEGWNGTGWEPSARWLEPVVGLLDDPENRRQGPLRIDLGREGHLLVYGAPGMGKTTFVQSLVTSLARAHCPADVHLYLMEGSGRSLRALGELPHVGAVVAADEEERVHRLLRRLTDELDRRKEALGAAGVSTLPAYRRSGGEALPGIVLVIDDYPAFAAAHEELEEQVAQLAREGGALGVHMVLTAVSPALVRHRVSSSIARAVTLPLVDRTEYPAALGRTDGMEPAQIPGRGLVKGSPPLAFQTALPAPGQSEWERTGALRALGRAMAEAWTGSRPEPVRVLPEVVPLAELVLPGGTVRGGADRERVPGSPVWGGGDGGSVSGGPAQGGGDRRQGFGDWPQGAGEGLRVPVGMEVESLQPFAVDLAAGPHFLIAGPAAGGKTTLLQSWLLSLAAHLPPERLELWLADLGGEGLAPLRALPHVRACAWEAEQLEAWADGFAERLEARRSRRAVEPAAMDPDGVGRAAAEPRALDAGPAEQGRAGPDVLLVAIDDYDLFREAAPEEVRERLEHCVRRERGRGFHLVAAGSADAFQAYDGLTRAIREWQTGFILGSRDHADLSVLNLRVPHTAGSAALSPGQGYFARRGRCREIKAATPEAGGMTLRRWVEMLKGGGGRGAGDHHGHAAGRPGGDGPGGPGRPEGGGALRPAGTRTGG